MASPTKFHDFLYRPWELARGALVEELQALHNAVDILLASIASDESSVVQELSTTGTQNNFVLGSATEVLIVSSASSTITGLSGVVAGRQVQVIYSGAGTCTLKHQDSGSIINYRLTCSTGADIVLNPDQGARLIYDSISHVWRVFP